MNPDSMFPPLAVIVPARIGDDDEIVSRPLAYSRERAPEGMPWVALAFGVTGKQWFLAPRRGGTAEETEFAIRYGMGAVAQMAFYWEVLEQTGLFRRGPSLLLGHVAPNNPQIPAELMWDLTVALLLHPNAMWEAADKLGSSHLMAGVRGRNELLIAPAPQGDPTGAWGFFRKLGPPTPDALGGDLVFHLDVTRREAGMIVGISGRTATGPYYSNAAVDFSSWEVASVPPQIRVELDQYKTELLRFVQSRGGAPIDYRMVSMCVQAPRGMPFEALWDEMGYLERMGLVVGHRDATGHVGAWSVTQPGDAIIRALKEVEVVPTLEEKLSAALEQGPQSVADVLREARRTPERFTELVLACLDKDPFGAPGALLAIAYLEDKAFQEQLRARVLAHARPEALCAYVMSLAKGKIDKPARLTVHEPPAFLASALQRALESQLPATRAHAAKVAYATGVVEPLVPKLVSFVLEARGAQIPVSPSQLVTPESPPEEWSASEAAFWAALALGCAKDGRSYTTLLEGASAPNEVVAVASTIALSLRTDTREAWFEHLDSPRPVVREAAIYGLRKIVTGLSDSEVERLQGHPAPDVAEAVRKYVLRRGRRPA